MLLLTVNLTSWGDRWALAGISVLTVFSILIILVLVLQIFSAIAKRGNPLSAMRNAADNTAGAVGTDVAAITMTLHLYYADAHDVESGILTIDPNASSAWHGDVEQIQ